MISYLFVLLVAFELIVFTGGAGLGGSLTGFFSLLMSSAMARSELRVLALHK
jgi:hypothetical protein